MITDNLPDVGDKSGPKAKRSWVARHKGLIVVLGLVAIGALSNAASGNQHPNQSAVLSANSSTHTTTPSPSHTPTPSATSTPVPTRVTTPTPTPVPAASSASSASNLSNNNYYTNTAGNQMHSPADSTTGQVPAGATAQCVDGTYSFSQTHSGTCSHHGGVATWL